MCNYYSKLYYFVNLFITMISNNMRVYPYQKPPFTADAVILIDCWGPLATPIQEDKPNPVWSQKEWDQYMEKFMTNCHNTLQTYNFPVLFSASYRNGESPGYSIMKYNNGEKQSAEFSPLHHLDYRCKPLRILELDAEMKDIYKYVPPRGKIIVGGGTFGACVHYRPVGMVKLLREGFRVFTSTSICYKEPSHRPSKTPLPGDIHLQELLWDDIVWSRCSQNGNFYDNIYEGIMVHPDNALGRMSGKGIPMNQS